VRIEIETNVTPITAGDVIGIGIHPDGCDWTNMWYSLHLGPPRRRTTVGCAHAIWHLGDDATIKWEAGGQIDHFKSSSPGTAVISERRSPPTSREPSGRWSSPSTRRPPSGARFAWKRRARPARDRIAAPRFGSGPDR
jgi:hypothetical protein